MRNSLQGLSSRIDQEEQRIYEVEYKMIDINQPGEQKENRMK